MSREKGLGHACGVKVQKVQRVQRVQRGRFLGLTGPMGRRVLKFDEAFGPEGCGGGSAASFIKKGRGFAAGCVERLCSLCSGGDSGSAAEGGGGGGGALRAQSFISRLRRSRQHRVSILSAYLVHPFPLRGTSPQGETRALRDWLSVSYGMISILLTGSLRSPPPIRLRRTSPYSGGQNKALKSSPFISSSQHNGAL